MSKEIKYPYIGEGIVSNNVVLFSSDKYGTCIKGVTCATGMGGVWLEDAFKNITHEYLQNTCGTVESKEHAGFIIKLAELHGYSIQGCGTDNAKCFAFYPSDGGLNEELYFYDIDQSTPLLKIKFKQITIPLPSKTKEWSPEVGDEVEYNNIKCKVLLAADKSGHIVADDNGNYINPHIDDIKKPKSAQDLKIEELHAKLCEINTVDNYILACDIVMGNIEGLSYE